MINRIDRLPQNLFTLCRRIADAGGHAWLVGGCVRDLMLGLQPHDFDLEVYGLNPEQLQQTIAQFGRTELVGRQFGVFKLKSRHLEIDLALPRSETKTGQGHRGFAMKVDPHLPPERASLRRDFTINAMMLDPLTGRIMDFHDGRKDLKNNILRHVSDAFCEDPLRPLRAMQFAARFGLTLEDQTASICAAMLDQADEISIERIWIEWQKWSHARTPSFGLQVLRDSGWLAHYSPLADLIDCHQSPRWHPEGDVWLHTLQVCDQAAAIICRQSLDNQSAENLMFAALCHDLGKPAVSRTDAEHNITSPGHSEAGVPLARQFLASIGAPERIFSCICPLILDHITHLHGQPTPRAVRRLASRLEPANIELWEMLVEADASGRAPAPPSRPALAWLQQAETMNHHRSAPAKIVTGKLLLELGQKPGVAMGQLIRQAYEAQLHGEFDDRGSAISWLHRVALCRDDH